MNKELSNEEIKLIAENHFKDNETVWLDDNQKNDTTFGFRIGYLSAMEQYAKEAVQKPQQKNWEEIFDNKFDCYADTGTSNKVIPAMTKNKFLQAVQQSREGGWIDVKERLPPVSEKVIGYFPDKTEAGRHVDTAIFYGEYLVSDFPNSTSYLFPASHWQPLPNPPATSSTTSDKGQQ